MCLVCCRVQKNCKGKEAKNSIVGYAILEESRTAEESGDKQQVMQESADKGPATVWIREDKQEQSFSTKFANSSDNKEIL